MPTAFILSEKANVLITVRRKIYACNTFLIIKHIQSRSFHVKKLAE